MKTAIPLLEAIEIRGKTLSGEALLTQRELPGYLVEERSPRDHFTVKGNQQHLLEATTSYFEYCTHPPTFTTTDDDHGRIETRTIWVPTELNHDLNFPHVGQAFLVERLTMNKTSGKEHREIADGITSNQPD